jgi:hypothetical protein
MSNSRIWILAILIAVTAVIGCVATRTKEPGIESRIRTVRLADIPAISPEVVQAQGQLVQIEDPVTCLDEPNTLRNLPGLWK